ncbi:MAG: DUF4388 domain-containing protein [Myxococcales bacterium]|nr:DUF4388 domain-containing protein [Myxococcales bacterium]
MSRRIILVTPNQREVDQLVPALEELGYQWKHLRWIVEASDLLESFSPDLIVVNAITPRGNVADFCQETRDRTGAKILLLSPFESTLLAFKARNRWAVDEVVTLPVPFKKLVTLIAYMVGDLDAKPNLSSKGDLAVVEEHPAEIQAAGNKLPLSGDLAEIQPGRIFRTLIHKQPSGILILGDGPAKRELILQDGRILELRTAYLEQLGLGDILVRQKVLDAETLPELVAEATEQKLRLGDLLRLHQMIGTHILFEALDLQIAEKLADVFNWEKGRYEFHRNIKKPQIYEPRDILLVKTVFLAARLSSRNFPFEEKFAAMLDLPIRYNDASPIRLNALDLEPEEKRFLYRLERMKTLRQALTESRLPAEATEALLTAAIHLHLILFPIETKNAKRAVI